MPHDPFTAMKAAARESWATFGPNAMFTTKPAATLVEWASVQRDERVLDVGCGTGVVAVTAAMRGAVVTALDLSPVLLDEARRNGARLPVTALVDQFYADLQEQGGRRWDTSSLIKRLV